VCDVKRIEGVLVEYKTADLPARFHHDEVLD
jgi:hypothetical protein